MNWIKKTWKWFTGLLSAAVGGGVAVLVVGSQVQFAGVPTQEFSLRTTNGTTKQPVAYYEDTTRIHNGDLVGQALVINGQVVRLLQYRMAGLADGEYATTTMVNSFPVKKGGVQ